MSANMQKDAAWEAGPLAFINRQFFQTVPRIPPHVSLAGQTAIVTGSNTGLGLVCSRQLLRLGVSRLILAVRSQTKGDAAAVGLRKQFPDARVEVWMLDMAQYKSVVAFAKRCGDELDRLDIVVLNVGLSRPWFERGEGGHEMTLLVNYLSTALLAILLIPVLKQKRGTKEPARLAMVGSDTAYWAAWPDVDCKSVFAIADREDRFVPMNAYKESKLLLLMFLQRLAERVSPEEVIINVPNPGANKGTDFGSDNPSKVQRAIFKVVGSIMGRNPEVGARQYVDAVAVQGRESHGGFVSEGRVKPYPPIMYEEGGKRLSQTLWEETMKEFEFAGVREILAVQV